MSLEALRQTRVGKSVSAARKMDSDAVQQHARQLVSKWRAVVSEAQQRRRRVRRVWRNVDTNRVQVDFKDENADDDA